MLNLITSNTITRDVTMIAPTGEEFEIKDVVFTYMDEADFLAESTAEGDDAINNKVVGWGEFLDGNKEQIEFSEEALAELMAMRWAQVSFITKYCGAIMGVDSKNFAASAALGQLAQARVAKKQNVKKATRKKRSKSSVKRKKTQKRT